MAISLRKAVLLLGDIIILYFALIVTFILRYSIPHTRTFAVFRDINTPPSFLSHLLPFSLVFASWILVLYLYELYALDTARNTIVLYATITQALAVCFIIAVCFFYFSSFFIEITPKRNLVLTTIFFGIFFVLWRTFFNHIAYDRARTPMIILGDGDESRELAEKISRHPQLGYEFFDYRASKTEDLSSYIRAHNISLIITSDHIRDNPKLLHELYGVLTLRVRFETLSSFYELLSQKVPISIIGKIWFLENIKNLRRPVYHTLKYIFDITCGLLIGIIGLIIVPLAALAIYLEDRGKIFYRQKRVGQDGNIFTLIKLRTMRADAEIHGAQFARAADTRITRVGRFLRDYRIDEIPQIINVLRGEMSLVGPRPERPEFVESFAEQIPYYNFRHLVKPGLTGWAQVHYEYGDSLEDAYKKLQYDLYYIKNRSLLLDLATLLKTIRIVLGRRGR